jgi:hypothetical protein
MIAQTLAPEARASLREMAWRLDRIARDDARQMHLARAVERSYENALARGTDDAWLFFFSAMHAFVELSPKRQSHDLEVLRSILEENADLLASAGDRVVRGA